MKRFADKVALITGAGSGIGRAAAERLASEGCKVVCIDVNDQGIQQTLETIKMQGGEAVGWRCDVTDMNDIEATINKTIAQYGKLNVLCNIAGIIQFENTLDVKMEDFDRVMNVNLRGTFMMIQKALPHLIESKGNIVNMSSTAALGAHAWTAAYSASKGAIQALTSTIAIEFGRLGVRCNAVCPASIKTPLAGTFKLPTGADKTLLQKIMPFDGIFREPADVAGAVAFLASDDAIHVNGDYIRTDGGMMS